METEVGENELQLRKRIVENHVKERHNCIVLKIDRRQNGLSNINPFAFHFELDKVKYEERKKQLKRERITQWFSWIAVYHHKFGIRHILLVFMLFLYVMLGASIFLAIEQPNEIKELAITVNLMDSITEQDVNAAINISLSLNGTDRENAMTDLFKLYYRSLLQAEGKFHGSTWHKAENIDLRRTWSFSSSAFYCITLFSTIGYGTLACDTTAGQIITIIYASIGLPIMLVVLGDLGEWFQKVLTKAYIICYLRTRKAFGKEDLNEEVIEDIFLPMWLAIPLVGLYLFLTTFFIHLFDHDEGQLPGIGVWDSFYFTFVSLTTIGLGDIMPYNIQYSPILACVFLLGLALVSIVNTSIYAQLYDLFFKTVNWVEEALEKIHRQKHHGTGYYVFQDMGPCIQLLVCSFPHIDDEEEKVGSPIQAIFAPFDMFLKHQKPKKTLVPHIFQKKKKRAEEGKDQVRKTRAPTLGAFGGGEISTGKHQRITRHASDLTSPKAGKKTRTFSALDSKERALGSPTENTVSHLLKLAIKAPTVIVVDETVSHNMEKTLSSTTSSPTSSKNDSSIAKLVELTMASPVVKVHEENEPEFPLSSQLETESTDSFDDEDTFENNPPPSL
ncbi:unnamed protein product [Auanema sp. JU1783]|nr:unnamed protein product [Auanema sp. JU1783]